MLKTFSYEISFGAKQYSWLVYAKNIDSSFEKWLIKLKIEENFENVFTFELYHILIEQNSLDNVKFQFLNPPYFFSFLKEDSIILGKVHEVQRSPPDFIAKLKFIKTEEGGKKSFVYSGYRPQIGFEGKLQMTSAQQIFIDKDIVNPEEEVFAEMKMLSPQLFNNYLFTGQTFYFKEANNILGYGEIVEIINHNLLR